MAKDSAVSPAKLEGDKEMLETLAEMKDTVGRRVMRSAVNVGLTPIRKEAKRRAPGTRISQLITKRTKTTSKGKVVGYVRVEDSDDKIMVEGRKVTFSVAANFLEFGTPYIRARKFMRGARQSKASEATNRMKEKAEERIDKEWLKETKKGREVFK